jgi:hypothetical protein
MDDSPSQRQGKICQKISARFSLRGIALSVNGCLCGEKAWFRRSRSKYFPFRRGRLARQSISGSGMLPFLIRK